MTREQQVKAALKLSKLPRDRYEAARASIENALDIMVDATFAHNVWKAARPKAAHKAERAYHQALRRLRTTYEAALAPGLACRFIPLSPISRAPLRRLNHDGTNSCTAPAEQSRRSQ